MQETTTYGLKKPELTDNVKISDFNDNADIIDAQLKTQADAVTGHLAETAYYSTVKSGMDSNGIYTEVGHKRSDGTLILKSVLSGGTSPKYTTRTETKYKIDGTTVEWTKTYTITYDSNDSVASEVLS